MDAPAADELRRGADQREGIDAVMSAKPLVLISKQHGEEARIDIGDPRGQPPAAFDGRIGAKQAAIAIDDPR